MGNGELIRPGDLAKLKSFATKMPGAFVVVAVLRDHFGPREKLLLRKFANWGRRPDSQGEPTNPIVLLTGNELMFDFNVSRTWKELGGQHARFADQHHGNALIGARGLDPADLPGPAVVR